MIDSAFRRFFTADRSRLLVALAVGAIAAVVGAGAAAGVVLTRSAVYESQAVLVIDQPQALATSGDAGIIVKLNALRLKYAALTETSAITRPVGARLDIPEAAVRAQAGAEATFDALVMRSVARAGSREGARVLAQAVAEQLVEFVEDEQAALPIDPSQRIELRIVEEAFPGIKVEPDEIRAVFVALATAVLAFAVAFVGTVAVLHRRRGGDSVSTSAVR